MGYSSEEEYEKFMKEVVPFEKDLISKGVLLFKFWLSITKDRQEKRFTLRQQSPLKYWKYSPNDESSQKINGTSIQSTKKEYLKKLHMKDHHG